MVRNLIHEVIDSSFFENYSSYSLEELEDKIKETRDKYAPKYINIYLKFETDYDIDIYNSPYLYLSCILCGTRLENDKEYEKRINKLKREKFKNDSKKRSI